MISYRTRFLSQSPGVFTLIGLCIGMYILEYIPGVNTYIFAYGELIPQRVFEHGELWRLLTYAFMHDAGSIWHIAFNMLALWMFGVELEARLKTIPFVVFYCAMALGAALFSTFAYTTPVIGASGAVLALLTVYALWNPDRQILMFFIFPMPVRIAVAIIGAISLFGSMGGGGGIAHLCHLGGIVAGFAYVKILPLWETWHLSYTVRVEEDLRRQRAQSFLNKEQYYTKVVDPLLKKISERGIKSLTNEEKKILQKAAETDPARLKKEQILPFEIFKKKRM